MKNARYNIPEIRRAMREVAEEIIALKKQIRQPNYLPTSVEYSDLKEMKLAYTILCCLRAHHRGKFHLKDQAKSLELAQRVEGQYLLQEAAA